MQQSYDPSRLWRAARNLMRLLTICFLTESVLVVPAWSATPINPVPSVQIWSGIPSDLGPVGGKAATTKASFKHSGMKTATYEIGNALNNFAFLSVGAGSLGAGLLLTSFNAMQSWTVYTTNDYLWQKYYPQEANTNSNGPFDLKQSVRRTTLKYMTGKPVVAAIKITALYLYTGSVATAVSYGLAATAGASVIFFINNLAWDYYDQTTAPSIPN